MHAHDPVNLDDAYRGDFIYNFASFEKFFNQVSGLLQDYKKVNNKITLREFELCERLGDKGDASKPRPSFKRQDVDDLLTKHECIKDN